MPIADHANITQKIYEETKQKLMRGELAPGTLMKIKPISDAYKVSQTPVREALLQLVSEQLLESSRAKSIRVPDLTTDDLVELRAIRLNLELMATASAVPNITKEIIFDMRMIHQAMISAKSRQDRSTTLQMNYEFHFKLYRACEKPRLIKMLESLWASTGPSLRHLYTPPFYEMPGTHPHIELLDALTMKDVKAAVKAIHQDVAGHGQALFDKIHAFATAGIEAMGTNEEGSQAVH